MNGTLVQRLEGLSPSKRALLEKRFGRRLPKPENPFIITRRSDTSAAPLDLDTSIAGAETTVERWTGCKTGGAAELWTIHGGSHIPVFNQPAWPDAMWRWFSSHPKP